MTHKTKVLLVEDDQNLGFLMSEFLNTHEFEVTLCKDGLIGWRIFNSQTFHFIILDVMLPELDGFALAKKIKEKQPEIPVIFVTAKSMKEDKIKGFKLGIDDYITKPFDEDELLCRIQAILNRIDNKTIFENIQIGLYSYDFQNQSLILGENNRRLTMRENEVIKLLIKNCGQIVKREVILRSIWGKSDYFSGRSLDVYISKLRKYLNEDPEIVIENIPKVGFLLQINDDFSQFK